MTAGQLVFWGIVVLCVALAVVYRAKAASMAEQCRSWYKEIKVEMRKVTWPSRAELIGNTLIVLVMVFVLTVIISIQDGILVRVVDLFFTNAGK